MIDEGALEGIDEVYGYHNTPREDLGKVFCPDTEIMAHVTQYRVTVKGKGGHGGYPQNAVDPIICAT
jgi:metal-dependent amidase/aminoacylase/carboxypeptidase family protein